jgi:hypothetical protein
MTSKEKVKLNLYKRMLEEEKKKNKRLKAMFLSVFAVGVFSLPVYEKYNGGGISIPNELNLNKTASPLSLEKNKRINLEQLLEDEIFVEKQIEMSEEELLSEFSI